MVSDSDASAVERSASALDRCAARGVGRSDAVRNDDVHEHDYLQSASLFILARVSISLLGIRVGAASHAGAVAGLLSYHVCLSICFAVGLFYRLASIGFFLGFCVIYFQDIGLYLNHFYLIIVLNFVYCFLPANRFFALDSLIGSRVTRAPCPTGRCGSRAFSSAMSTSGPASPR
jgi:hypothetical protein